MKYLLLPLLLVASILNAQPQPLDKIYHDARIEVFHNYEGCGLVSIVEYGADPEGIEPCDSALQAMLDDEIPGIFIPPGEYLFLEEKLITYSVYITGIGFNEGSFSILKFPESGGFNIIHGGDYASFENLKLIGSSRSGNGITIQAHGVKLDGLFISSFGKNGIEVSSGANTNANHTSIRDCRVFLNGNDGIRLGGNNAHVIMVDHCDAMLNGRWGFNDASFLGTNTFNNCHAGGNKGGGYRIGHQHSRSMLMNCYAEADQPPNHIEVRATVFRGLLANGFTEESRGCVDYLCH